MNTSFSYLFLQSIKEALSRQCNLHRKYNRILIACSGGADSVVLLHSLAQLRDELDIDLNVCHVNHGLRGKESDADELFVIDLANQLDIPCCVERFSPKETEQTKQGNLEECAREIRYVKLNEAARKFNCTHIATGHTQSDQAETVLHRILRSTGSAGLCGILPFRKDLGVPVIRPLLSVGRDKVIRYAHESHLSFRQDSMNEDDHFTRVRIRNNLLPKLRKEYNPNIDEALARLASIAQDDEAFWKTYVDNLELRVGLATSDIPGDRKRFLHLSNAERSRLLRRYCQIRDIEPSWRQIEDALNLLTGERPQAEIHLNANHRLYRRYDYFYFAPPIDLHENNREYDIEIPGQTDIPELGIRTIAVIMPAEQHRIKPLEVHTVEFDAEKVIFPVVIRTRREGDVIRPFGMGGSKKIKKVLQEHHIPLEQRDKIPMLCFDQDIAWIASLCVSDTYRIEANTKKVLLISIHPIS